MRSWIGETANLAVIIAELTKGAEYRRAWFRLGNNGGSWEPPSQKENKVGRKFLGLYHAILS